MQIAFGKNKQHRLINRFTKISFIPMNSIQLCFKHALFTL